MEVNFLVKITKEEYKDKILKSGFVCKDPIAKSGKRNKYYYLTENDYNDFLSFVKNNNILGVK